MWYTATPSSCCRHLALRYLLLAYFLVALLDFELSPSKLKAQPVKSLQHPSIAVAQIKKNITERVLKNTHNVAISLHFPSEVESTGLKPQYIRNSTRRIVTIKVRIRPDVFGDAYRYLQEPARQSGWKIL